MNHKKARLVMDGSTVHGDDTLQASAQETYCLQGTLDGYEVSEISAQQFIAWYRVNSGEGDLAFPVV